MANFANASGEKRVSIAYICWIFGGWLGLHHFYLRRDRHAFVWWTTFGGFIIGWLGEVFSIPHYVRFANNDPQAMKILSAKMVYNKKPPFSMQRFTSMLLVGYTWANLLLSAIPPEEYWDIDLRFLRVFVPLMAALGVWTVGNIGREKGTLMWPLLAAYVTHCLTMHRDVTEWLFSVVLISALCFDTFSKEWQRTPRKHHSLKRRILVLGVCGVLFLSLWCSYLYFHGTITDSDGDEVPVYEALHHFFTSPWWLDIKECLYDIYNFAQHHGWYEVWRQIIEMTDPNGEQNAFKVLGLTPSANQREITAAWRSLSREHHPDKVKDESLRNAAHEKFMEIQQAYNILSHSKTRRYRKNKKDNSENTNKP